jgi:endonuclease/exonuclease/phosphatase family metal-dependent hydrolase
VVDAAANDSSGSAELTLVTWNTWFARDSFEPRFRALLAEIRAHDPDVVCLQEVVAESLGMLLNEPWVQDAYSISDATGETVDPYGVVILSRLPVQRLSLYDLPSYMGRRLLVADLVVGGRPLAIGTVHLESRKRNSDVRADQLRVAQPLLRGHGPDAALVGDFNLCASWTSENAGIDPDFVDLWSRLHPADPGYTEDTERNPMLLAAKGREKRVRFDRVFLRSVDGAFRGASIELLGRAPNFAACRGPLPLRPLRARRARRARVRSNAGRDRRTTRPALVATARPARRRRRRAFDSSWFRLGIAVVPWALAVLLRAPASAPRVVLPRRHRGSRRR